jgi:hypothetical protein
MSTGFNVYLGRKWIDKVFYSDPRYTAAEVKRSLVEHDGYDPRIKVTKERKKKNPSKRSVRKRVAAALKKWVRGNPHRVKGRKVKGGRAVTLKNMKSVTITRHSNGAVSVRGVQLKGRKR